jgi:hypothetical protein
LNAPRTMIGKMMKLSADYNWKVNKQSPKSGRKAVWCSFSRDMLRRATCVIDTHERSWFFGVNVVKSPSHEFQAENGAMAGDND